MLRAAGAGVAIRESASSPLWAVRRLLPFVAIAALPVLFMVPLLAEPLTRDEAVYFTMAMFDDLPYTSVFDHKPPLVYVWYKLALMLNGGAPSVEIARLIVGIHLGVTALVVAWTGALLGGRRLAVGAGVLMAAAVSNQYLEFHTSTESLMLPWLAFALGAQIKALDAKDPRWMLVSGFALGIATMTKSVAAVNLVVAGFAFLWAARSGLIEAPFCARMLAAMASGFAVVLVAVALPWIVTGQFDDFWFANIGYNLSYGDRSLIERTFALTTTDSQVLTGALWLWVLACVGVFIIASRTASLPHGLVVASFVASWIGSTLAGRGFPHYAIAIVPFAALLAGVGLLAIADSPRRHARQLALICIAVCAALTVPSLTRAYLATPEEAMLAKDSYSLHAQRALVVEDVARAVRDASNDGDRVFELGLDTQIFVLARREPAVYFNRPLAAFRIAPGSFERTMLELERRPPEIIVDSAPEPFQSFSATHATRTEGVTDLAPKYREAMDALISERYEHVATVEFAKIYRLRRPS